MYLNKNYTIGADPEIFLYNIKTKKIVSAIDKIPGQKEAPYTEGLPEGYGLQTDNVLAEFNIPPVRSEEDFVKNIEFMKNIIRNKAKDIDSDFDVLCVASSKVPLTELKHPQAKRFGCDPDYCLYTQTQNYISRNPRSTLRSGGFHIHIGYPEHNIDTSLEMLRYVDAIVGLASILYDTDMERRKLYGKAGCFRLTSYGFEYRTLSSYWLGNESRLRFIYKQIQMALYAYENHWSLPNPQVVEDVINNNLVEKAKSLLEDYNFLANNDIKPE